MANLLSPEEFFKPWEVKVHSWNECNEAIQQLREIAGSRELAWRGVSSASYALHSSAHRSLIDSGIKPSEGALIEQESNLISSARANWRFDNLSALELLAQIQHFGGATRLLDVTFNPLVAIWFAVRKPRDPENTKNTLKSDGRIFVFDVTDRHVTLDKKWGARELPWHPKPESNWSTELPRVWRPPSYNQRIPAQNSAFLIGGFPIAQQGTNARYRKSPGDGTKSGLWKIEQVRAATSVPTFMNALSPKPSAKAKPTYTIRIMEQAKEDIGRVLDSLYGISTATLFPDVEGLARFGAF
jgi:hypothetical protein